MTDALLTAPVLGVIVLRGKVEIARLKSEGENLRTAIAALPVHEVKP
jgi:hypothetical protein